MSGVQPFVSVSTRIRENDAGAYRPACYHPCTSCLAQTFCAAGADSRSDPPSLPWKVVGPISCPTVLLWIDDEISREDFSVQLLELEIGGLEIECAGSGTLGLHCALTRTYAGIVLDLRLPDMDGLGVLERITAAGISTPVLVLSGWADAASTVRAIRLGAFDVKSKPLFGTELTTAIAELLAAEPVVANTGNLQLLSPDSTSGDARAIRSFVHALARPLSSEDFVLLARAFRRALDRTSGGALAAGRTARSTAGTNASSQYFPAGDPARSEAGPRVSPAELVGRVARHLESTLSAGNVLSEADVAEALNLRAIEIGYALATCLRMDFNEFRRGVRVRPAVREVAYSLEQFAQIAYRCGYQHPSQFNRDFLGALGLPPRQFRGLALVPPVVR